MNNSVAPPVGGYEFGGFLVDVRRRGLWRQDGSPVQLTARLFRSLLLFVERPGELLDKEWLMAAIWPGMDVGENSLSQVICSLRRALRRDGRAYIQTESRHGFRFVCPVTVLPPTGQPWLESAGVEGAGALPDALARLSYILAVQDVITRHLADMLAPHQVDATQPGPVGITLAGSGGRAPSRTPAFQV
jgi:DNA-binding winged helix-turn-helix (wHTH) protein